jgi:hypothetical protein
VAAALATVQRHLRVHRSNFLSPHSLKVSKLNRILLQGCQIFLVTTTRKNTPKWHKTLQVTTTFVYRMLIKKIPNGYLIYQNFLPKGLRKCIKTDIFGMKMATPLCFGSEMQDLSRKVFFEAFIFL